MIPCRAKVLFVDDETPFLDTLIKRMEIRGLDVHGVDCGGSALAYLGAHPVDVVVLDVRMPGLGGLEVLKQIRLQWPAVETILLTGHACMASAMDFMHLGAFDYLMKPVALDELIFRIEDAYEKILLSTQSKKQN